jgi:hypothetical protein
LAVARTVAGHASSRPPRPARRRRGAAGRLRPRDHADLRGDQAAGGGPELDELLVRASCDSACTIKLKELSALRFRTRGGVAQLPNGASGPLRGSKRAAAGAAVTFRVAVPAPVQQFALSAFRAQEAVVGTLVATVEPVAGGTPVEAVRQVVAVVGSTPSPYPASPLLDVLRLPARVAKKPGRKLRWELSIRGTRTSRWSYDRSTTEGTCKMLDAGSGTQKLTFRSTRRFVVEQVIWRTGELKLRQPDYPYSGAFVPVQVDAVRDSREQKGADGDCGGGGGGLQERDRPDRGRRPSPRGRAVRGQRHDRPRRRQGRHQDALHADIPADLRRVSPRRPLAAAAIVASAPSSARRA